MAIAFLLLLLCPTRNADAPTDNAGGLFACVSAGTRPSSYRLGARAAGPHCSTQPVTSTNASCVADAARTGSAPVHEERARSGGRSGLPRCTKARFRI